ncbi:hypothetical protein L228DRAFT_244152 [Xylona heveae TC161]|uniref:Uncharacterized protein n=1 Tax=Xylona heveae (strain CBS 132557 / TC161) TaxID=1328760 RepID=A0A165ISW3_XYLHT|nr:hypothetical protein L228DRAFT_244152 [Xylona heveae TC161]KZF25340.1 hypothetical protein L228DRAFT_244152 [Xylona heveae TC161]
MMWTILFAVCQRQRQDNSVMMVLINGSIIIFSWPALLCHCASRDYNLLSFSLYSARSLPVKDRRADSPTDRSNCLKSLR